MMRKSVMGTSFLVKKSIKTARNIEQNKINC